MWHRTRRWPGALVLAALLLAACGGGGGGPRVASAGGATTTTAANTPAAQHDPLQAGLAFAKCMREHGVDVPDPKPGQGGLVRIAPGASTNPDDPKVRAAETACRPLLGAGGTGAGPDDPKARAAMLDFAKCMRANGVENFPDPTGNGDIAIGGSNGVDPSSPAFQKAQRACQSKLGGQLQGPTP
jgi:hypothetical protein